MTPEVSVVIPVYNEEESLPGLISSLETSLKGLSCEYVMVNDGSTDRTRSLLEEKARQNGHFRAVNFTRNFGQTAALAAGIEASRGEIIVCLDADGQNDPADIPKLVQEINNGSDVVSGWRMDRKDPWFSRRLPSKIANAVISCVTGVHLHDYGCTLKAYRRGVIQDIRFYGEMHRFIPAWCAWKGAKVTEVKVAHHPRLHGKSKYGLMRIFKVVLDLITAKFFFAYLTKPSYFFGGTGIVLLTLSFLAGLFPFIDKFVLDSFGHLRIPFMILSVFLGLAAVQFIVFGLLAEILIRIYYENKSERPYRIADIVP